MSSIWSKIIESVILTRMSNFLKELNLPDCLQTAYQKGLSCADAVFVTQEALLTHLREGGHPYLCLFDLEKAFDSVEFPNLLNKLFQVGIRGKLWRIILKWYTSAKNRIRVNGVLSDSYNIIHRGVKQGSVLSPLLFVLILDDLLKNLRKEEAGLTVGGNFVGGAAHADDLRTAAISKESIMQQWNIINKFTTSRNLKLNSSKTEILKISRKLPGKSQLNLSDHCVNISTSVKCLGIWWQHDLKAQRAVKENISKARKAFFAFGKLDAFEGKLNPLSSSSIYMTCVLSVLLYGCETWILDKSMLSLLENFPAEIGRRILKLY